MAHEPFTGKELDSETDLQYFGARYYMAALGRWGAVDPHADRYPGASPYNYVLGNPNSLVDPDGRDPTYPIRFFAGGAVGAISEVGIQGLEIMIGVRKEMDWGDVAFSGTTGAVTGGFTTVQNMGRLARTGLRALNVSAGVANDWAAANGGSDRAPEQFDLTVSIASAVVGEAVGEMVEGAHRLRVQRSDPEFRRLSERADIQERRATAGRRTRGTASRARAAAASYRGTESAAAGSASGSFAGRVTSFFGRLFNRGESIDQNPIPSR